MSVVIRFLLALMFGWPMLAVAAPMAPVTDQLIIQYRDTDSSMRRAQSLQPGSPAPEVSLEDGRELKFVRRMSDGAVVVRLPEQVSLQEARRIAAQLALQEAVASVEPDRRVYPALVPTDPFYTSQWYLYEDTAGIRMPSAWDRQTGSAGVVIAVLDTGILDHADIDPSRVLDGYDFISSTRYSNDGDGRDADASDPGDAVVAGECGPGQPAENVESSWHGLAVAGVMVATVDNLDIAGMDFAARLLPVRVLGKCGGDISDVSDAIRWAAGLSVPAVPDNPFPADVINLSLSGEAACSGSEQAAIDAAVATGALVIAAAGNEASDTAAHAPANCQNVIAVGAIGRDGARASYVNVGEEVDISAPGGDGSDGIRTLDNSGATGPGADALALLQGTSFTSAQVSAVASLMLAADPGLAPSTLTDYLLLSTRAFPDSSCTTCTCGQGILDADAAVAAATNPSLLPSTPRESLSCASATGASADDGDSSGGGGGGGCVFSPDQTEFDIVWALLMLMFFWRAAKRVERTWLYYEQSRSSSKRR